MIYAGHQAAPAAVTGAASVAEVSTAVYMTGQVDGLMLANRIPLLELLPLKGQMQMPLLR